MTMVMDRNSIVSVTDLVKNFAKVRQQAKEGSRMIVFKNNKPDLAILDIDEYEELLKIVELMDNYTILNMVEERDKNDDGTRYTTEEVVAIRKKRLLQEKDITQQV